MNTTELRLASGGAWVALEPILELENLAMVVGGNRHLVGDVVAKPSDLTWLEAIETEEDGETALGPLDLELVYDSVTEWWFLPQSVGGGELLKEAEDEAGAWDVWFRDDEYAREVIAALERWAPARRERRSRVA